MPTEPIKIPQNVYIEDRVVGPLTLKQIITVAIGCGFSYAFYSILVKSYGAVPLPITVMAWIPGALSFAFAFLRFNDISLFRICILMVERMNKPSTRMWTPRRGLAINIRTFTTPDQSQANKANDTLAQSDAKLTQLNALTSILDQSPHSNTVEDSEPMIPAPTTRPVDRTRISAGALNGTTLDTVTPPKSGTVSIFRDLSHS